MRLECLFGVFVNYDVVVVVGFQGVIEKGDIIMIGRGGSDMFVVVFGVVVDVEYIDIFIDVEGVMIVDLRVVENVKLFFVVIYIEICNLVY